MAAIVTNTIMPSGGDYGSGSSFESARNGGLVAADEERVGLYSGTWASRDSTAIDIDGGTSDATRYLVLRADSANRALITGLDTGRARLGFDGAGGTNFVRIADNYARLEGLQVEPASTISGSSSVICDAVIGYAIGCRIRGAGAGFGPAAVSSGSMRCINTVVYFDTGTTPTGLCRGQGAQVILYNCTIDSRASATHVSTGSGGTYIAKNTVAFGAGGTCFGAGATTASCNNNASRDTSAPGASSLTSISDPFNAASSMDYRLAIGASLRAAGADLSADGTYAFSDDFDQATRPATWSIGAWEPPYITALSPADGATGVDPDADLVITFSKDVAVGSGAFTVVETGVGDAETETLPDAAVTFSSNVVTWARSVTLDPSTGYHATLASGAVALYAGISGTTPWNWTTDAGGGGTTVNATGSAASVAVAAGTVTPAAEVAATGQAAAIAVAAGQAVASVTVTATGSGIGVAVAAGQVAAAAEVAAAGSAAGLAAQAGQVTPDGVVDGTGAAAGVAVAAGTATAQTGLTVTATGSGIGLAVAAGQVAVAAVAQATGSGASITAAAGQATIPGAARLASVRGALSRSFPGVRATLADEQRGVRLELSRNQRGVTATLEES